MAREVGDAVAQENLVARSQRFRLVFLGRWIRHCGWYGGSWVVRLGRRDALSYDLSTPLGERAIVKGKVGRLRCDIVDEDRKGFAAWLRKHVSYAEAEAARRGERSAGVIHCLRAVRKMRDQRPWTRTVAKEVLIPLHASEAAGSLLLHVSAAERLAGRPPGTHLLRDAQLARAGDPGTDAQLGQSRKRETVTTGPQCWRLPVSPEPLVHHGGHVGQRQGRHATSLTGTLCM